ncbi:MAG: DUF554 domain-containing protein [Chloroflexi bacterium]|nr:DUF554 domain-containing protein [Chloroflexota bacterium]MDA0244806.1 DUF554 domain-containing protein [Chloroflexota bacterium]
MIGTWLNALTVLVGGTLGTWLGGRFPERMQETIFAALGLFTLFIGFSSALATGNPLIALGSLVIGALLGEALRLDARLEQFGAWLQRTLSRGEGNASRFVEGFVTASLVFCVGPLTIQGAIEDGLRGDYTLLAIKSVLDGFAALAFAATLGTGVLASILVIILFQGGISLLASLGTNIFTEPMVAEMTGVGGIVLLSIGLRLLNLKQIRSANLLPALFIAPAAVALMDALGIPYYPL